MSTSKRDVDADFEDMHDLLGCERAIEVEDLTLGLLSERDALAAREHVIACAPCRDAMAAFERERSLFRERACQLEVSHVAPCALSTPALVESVEVEVARSSRRRHAVVRQLSQSFVAFAACAATTVLALSGQHVSSPSAVRVDGRTPTHVSSSSEVLASFEQPRVTRVPSEDSVALACAVPMGDPSPITTDHSEEAPLRGAVCEAPLSSSGSGAWRVTSPFATP